MKTTLTTLVLLAGFCLVALPERATAADPCAPDIQKLCAGVERGGGRIIKCLREHEAELSDACKARIAAAKAEQMKKNPCAADADKFCKGVEPGEGRVAKCLKQHEADLSAACKEARAANRQRRAPTAAPKPTSAPKP